MSGSSRPIALASSSLAIRLCNKLFGPFIHSNMADSILCTVGKMEEDLQTTIRRRLSSEHHLLQLP